MSSRCRPDAAAAALAALVLILAPGCRRERRDLANDPVLSAAARGDSAAGAGAARPGTLAAPSLDNVWELHQGERLFAQMNCAGCHARGGGNIGPPLMDSVWVYGREPDSLFVSIAAGRPNGMPGYGRLTDRQLWQLVGYVHGMERPRAR